MVAHSVAQKAGLTVVCLVVRWVEQLAVPMVASSAEKWAAWRAVSTAARKVVHLVERWVA